MADLIKREPAAAVVVSDQPEQIWLDECLDGKEIKYLQVVLKRKWLILSVMVLATGAAAAWTFTTKPLYKSTVKIQIDPAQGGVLPYKEIELFDPSTNPRYLETQAEVLKSEMLARRVVERLKLATDSDRLARTAQWFMSRLEVSPIEQTQVMRASFRSEDPAFAPQAINTLAAEYIDYSFDSKRAQAMKARDFLEKELLALKPTLERSEEALVDYARDHNLLLTAGDREGSVVLQKLTDLNQEMSRVEVELRSNQFDNIKDGRPEDFPESLKTGAIKELERRLSSLQEKQADMTLQFGAKWPEAIALNGELADVKQQLERETKRALAQVKLEHDLALAHRARVAAALAAQQRVVDQLGHDSIQYNVLKREVETGRQLRDGLLQRLKETDVSASFKSASIHVLDRGQLPTRPDSPNVPRNLGLGMVLGLMSGFMVAFFFEFLDRTVRTPEDVEQVLGLPFLAVIPSFQKSWRKATGGLLLQGQGDSAPTGLVPYAEVEAYWESYRALRISLLLSSPDRRPQSILVTSAVPEEGKSTTAINLGISLAQTGARTVILELDMRKPSTAASFHPPRASGMSLYLSGHSELNTEILQTGIPNFFIVPSGPLLPNSPELIGSKRMGQGLQLLSRYFDYIVIDSPPLMAVTDALVIATQVDGVLLVVQGGKTSKATVQKARNLLRSVDARILGVLVNDVDTKNQNFGYYQHAYGGQSSHSAAP